jgi:hypothetical protein
VVLRRRELHARRPRDGDVGAERHVLRELGDADDLELLPVDAAEGAGRLQRSSNQVRAARGILSADGLDEGEQARGRVRPRVLRVRGGRDDDVPRSRSPRVQEREQRALGRERVRVVDQDRRIPVESEPGWPSARTRRGAPAPAPRGPRA